MTLRRNVKDTRRHQHVLMGLSCLFFAGLSAIVPFLTLHMRSLGLSTMLDLMCVQTASGIACCILPFFVVSVAERRFVLSVCFNSEKESPRRSKDDHILYKWCLCGCLFAAAALYASFLVVPREVHVPRQPLMDFDCGATFIDIAALRVEKCSNWNSCRDIGQSWPKNTRFKISHCRQRCPTMITSSNNSTSSPSLAHPLHICFRKSVTHSDDISTSKHFCKVQDTVENSPSSTEFEAELGEWKFSEFRNVSAIEIMSSDSSLSPAALDICAYNPSNIIWMHGKAYEAISCRPAASDPSCSLQCLLAVFPGINKDRLFYNKVESACYDVIGDYTTTFWFYLALRATADAFATSVVCLLDMQFLSIKSSKYGRILAWPAAASGVTPPAVGALVDYFSEWSVEKTNYSPAFLIGAGSLLVACAVAVVLPTTTTAHKFRRLRYIHVRQYWDLRSEGLYVITLATAMGSLWGFSEVFSSWLYQQELTLNHWVIGTGEMLCFGCSLPLLIWSFTLLETIGETQIVAAAFTFHGLRLLGLSFMTMEETRWWWPLPFEAMRSMSLPLQWIALCARGTMALAHDSLQRRILLQVLLLVMHFGAGRVLGVLIGGSLSDAFGFALTLRILGVTAIFFALASLSIHHTYFRLHHRNKVSASQRDQIERVLSEGSRVDLGLLHWSALNGGYRSRPATLCLGEEDEVRV